MLIHLVHALVAAVLMGEPGSVKIGEDAEADPPDGERGEAAGRLVAKNAQRSGGNCKAPFAHPGPTTRHSRLPRMAPLSRPLTRPAMMAGLSGQDYFLGACGW